MKSSRGSCTQVMGSRQHISLPSMAQDQGVLGSDTVQSLTTVKALS